MHLAKITHKLWLPTCPVALKNTCDYKNCVQLMGLMVCLEEGNNKVEEEIRASSNESKDAKVLSSSNSSSTKTATRTNKKKLKD